MNQRDLATKYFRAQEAGNVEKITALCSGDAIINEKPLLEITSKRTFELYALAEEGDVVYAWWRCDAELHNGAFIYIHGITRFLFDDAGLIRELDSGHETVA